MGTPPGLIQLQDTDIRDQQTSHRIDTNTPDVPGNTESAEIDATLSDTENGPNQADIDEARRASWGQPAVEDELGTDEDNPKMAYRDEDHEMGANRVEDADWNTSTNNTDNDENLSANRSRGTDRM